MSCERRIFFIVLQFGEFFLCVDLEAFLDDEHSGDDADHAEGISSGITHRHLLADIVAAGVDLQESLLGSTKSGGVGDGAAHDAHKLRYRGVAGRASLDEEDGEHDRHVETDAEQGEHVHGDASFLERGEESRAHLHTDGEDEENQSELAEKMQHVSVGRIAEMAEKNADKEHERDSERHTENFKFSQIDAGENHERIEENRACQRIVSGPDQVDKPIH